MEQKTFILQVDRMTSDEWFNDIDRMITTGDMLLFSGDSLSSKIIGFLTDSHYSHVGIVYQCPLTKQKYIWEIGNILDEELPIITRKGADSCDAHLIPMRTRIEKYEGNIMLRKLNKPIDQDVFTSIVAKMIGTPYNENFALSYNERFMTSIIHIAGNNTEGLICSELVHLTYIRLGVMSNSTVSRYSVPNDFADELSTKKPFSFSPCILIK